MSRAFFALLLFCPLHAQHVLYSCASTSREYVVGSKLQGSGLFRKAADGSWQQVGYNHPFLSAVDADSSSLLYLAGGNGLIRATEQGQRWTILTGSDVTELRDVAVDRHSPATVYFAHVAGIRMTRDGGATWRELSGGLPRKYTEALRVDRTRAGVLLAGGEAGIYRSEDAGSTWRLAGAAGHPVTRIEQSPHDPCWWLAGTQAGGLFSSRDCGRTFEASGRVGYGHTVYDLAFDPQRRDRVALAVWGLGVLVSEDAGQTWKARMRGLPGTEVESLAWDPDHPSLLYVSIHELALYVSDDAGMNWRKDGLEGGVITRLRFIPERPAK